MTTQSRRDWLWERISSPPGHWRKEGVRRGDRDQERVILARHPSNCDFCGFEIEQGDQIRWHPILRYCIHFDCELFFAQWSHLPPRSEPLRVSRAQDVDVRYGREDWSWESESEKHRREVDGKPDPRRLHQRETEAWSREEDERLSEAFRSGRDIIDLSRIHGRPPGRIHARLLRLGLL